jgi:hypothetical protein
MVGPWSFGALGFFVSWGVLEFWSFGALGLFVSWGVLEFWSFGFFY